MKAVRLILLVEDDDTLRYIAMQQIKKVGYIAHYATNGAEAVRLVKERCYDLILMDVMMPVMDGLEATSQIRLFEQKEGRPYTPIIAMTAFQEKERCAQAGMDAYLFKPVLLDDLEKALRAWLQPGGNTNTVDGTTG